MWASLNGLVVNGIIVSSGDTPPAPPGGSILFDGNTYLNVAASSDWNIGTGDFTVEWFLKPNEVTDTFPRVFQFGGYPAPFGVSVEPGLGVGIFYLWIDGNDVLSTSVTYDTWHHMAATRQSGAVRIFVDGDLKAQTTNNSNITMTGIPMTIGADPGDVNITKLDGNLTNFNYVVGTALYTSTFVPPTSPISANLGTKLLLLASTEQTLLTDSGPLNKTVNIVTGTPTWSSASPF